MKAKKTADLSLFLTVTGLLLASLAVVYTARAQTYHFDSLYQREVRYDTTRHGDTMYIKELDAAGHTLIEWGPNYPPSGSEYGMLSIIVVGLTVCLYFLFSYGVKKIFKDPRLRFWATLGLALIFGIVLLFFLHKTFVDRWQRDWLIFIAYIVITISCISIGSYLVIQRSASPKSSPLRIAVGVALIAVGIAGIAIFLFIITHAIGM